MSFLSLLQKVLKWIKNSVQQSQKIWSIYWLCCVLTVIGAENWQTTAVYKVYKIYW